MPRTARRDGLYRGTFDWGTRKARVVLLKYGGVWFCLAINGREWDARWGFNFGKSTNYGAIRHFIRAWDKSRRVPASDAARWLGGISLGSKPIGRVVA